VKGIRLRCRAHNQHTAERDFGTRHMNRFRKREKTGEKAPSRAPGGRRQQDLNPVALDSAPGDSGGLDSASTPSTLP
jgi:hypothetical protein